MGQNATKSFWRQKMNYLLNYLYSDIVYKRKQQLLVALLKKASKDFFRKMDMHLYVYQECWLQRSKTNRTKYGKHWQFFPGHKIKTIPSWKTIYPTNGLQIAQLSLRTKLGDPEDSIS